MRKLFKTICTVAALTFSSSGFAGEVNLYTSNSADSVAVAIDIIKQKAPDLKVNVIAGGSGSLLRRIQAEKNAPSADIFWSSGFSTLASFVPLFEEYNSPQIDKIFTAMRGEGKPWTGTNTHVMVLMVNETQLGNLKAPTKWTDIFSDEWKGKVTMSDPNNSSSAYAQLYGIWKLYGEEGVAKLAKVVETQGKTSGVYKAVAQGEFPLGLTMEYAAQRYVAGGQSEIKLVYPKDGTFLSPEGLALIKGAPNNADAKRLYDIFLSKELQEAVFSISFRRPSRMDINQAIETSGLPQMDNIKIIDIDQNAAAKARASLLAIWAKARK